MWFRQLFDPESSTYTYLVGDDASGDTLVIDPVQGREADVLAQLAGRTLRFAVDTHVHADHITAGSFLRERTGARIALPALASDCGCADLTLAEGDELRVGALVLRVLHTPGHTPESLCLVAGDQVFTGDTLLVGTCGRTDFQGGDAGALYDSITGRLYALADATTVWPGHDYAGRTHTTIGAERVANTRVAGRSRAEFIVLMDGLDLPPPKKLEEAVPANRRCGLDRTPQGA